MSSSTFPITPQRFAEAILELPLPTLHIKAAEIRNSISHLENSNIQLQPFADEGDRDCTVAIQENKATILRMEERVLMLKCEVEGRGSQFIDDAVLQDFEARERISNGNAESGRVSEPEQETPQRNGHDDETRNPAPASGLPRYEEPSRRLPGRIDDGEEENNGVHL